ncbi:hypothetical protein [Devosia sp. 1566]|uniref:hypothetical protein n=1 Tax=Devosia sp. 1566 TaxID=2499144 RepID=UPI0013E36D00|nr:hypothetical protein [Devosia sp. 1566]
MFFSEGVGQVGTGSVWDHLPAVLSDEDDKQNVLQFGLLNMFNPKVGQSGKDALGEW